MIGADAKVTLSIRGAREASVGNVLGSTSKDVTLLGQALERMQKGLATELGRIRMETRQTGEALREMNRRAEEATRKMQGLATAGALATVAGGIAKFAIEAAMEFGKLHAQLQAITGSSIRATELMAQAKQTAQAVPFDVAQITQATVTLTAYGQTAQEVLPRVADLAAGMKKDLVETSLAVAKALSGSATGFRTLRNEYGIGSRELQRYGAELTKAGGLSLKTAEQQAAASKALMAILDARFAGAAAKQMETLGGQLSNLRDAVKNLGEVAGSSLIPVLKLGVLTIANLARVAALVPGPVLGTAAAMLALAGATKAAQVALLTMTGQQGLAGLGVMAAKTGALLGMAISLPVAAVAATVAAIGSVGLAWFNYNAELEKSFQVQGELRRQATATGEGFATQREQLAGAGVPLAALEDAGRAGARGIGALSAAITSMPGAAFQQALHDMGVDLETLSGQIEGASRRIEVAKANIQALMKLREGLDTDNEVSAKTPEQAGLMGVAPGTWVTGEAIERRIKQFLGALNTDQVTKAAAVAQKTATEAAIETEKAMATSAGRIRDGFSRLSEASLSEQATLIARGKAELEKLTAELGKVGLPADPSKLRMRLFEDITPELRAAIDAYLGAIKSVEGAEKARTDQVKQEARERGQAVLQSLEELKTKREVSFTEEMQYLKAARQMAEGNAELQGQIDGKIVARRKAQRAEELRDARQGLEAAIRPLIEQQAELRAGGQATAAELLAGDKANLAALEAWRVANQRLIDQYPEIAAAFRKTKAELTTTEARDQEAGRRERMTALKDSFEVAMARLVDPAQKIALIEQQMLTIQADLKRGLLDRKEAQKQLVDLTTAELELQKQIDETHRKATEDMAQLDQDAAQARLELLKQRKESGDLEGIRDINEEIKRQEREVLRGKLDAIERERKANIAGSMDKADAAAIANRQINALLTQETQRVLDEQQKQTDAVRNAKNKQRAIMAGTPMSPADAFGPNAAFPTSPFESGTFGQSNLDKGSIFRKKPSTQAAEQEARHRIDQARPGGSEAGRDAVHAGVEAAKGKPGAGPTNISFTVNGTPAPTEAEITALAFKAAEKLLNQTKTNDQRRPAGGMGGN